MLTLFIAFTYEYYRLLDKMNLLQNVIHHPMENYSLSAKYLGKKDAPMYWTSAKWYLMSAQPKKRNEMALWNSHSCEMVVYEKYPQHCYVRFLLHSCVQKCCVKALPRVG